MSDRFPYIFNKHELKNQFDNDKQFDNWIQSKIKSGKIKKVRNGLYVAIDNAGNVFPSKYEIGSHITKDSFISYHSALEYYGIANQVFTDVTVASSTKFNAFEFDGVEYNCKVTKNYEQVKFAINANLRVGSLERSIIDCIDNIALAGGIEEVLNALEQIKLLDENKLLAVLESYDKVLLYQKVGFMLEQYKEQLDLSDDFFAKCRSKLTRQIKYFLQDDYDNLEYDSAWKLMVPQNIKSIINGGF